MTTPRVLIVRFPPPLKGCLESLARSLPLAGYHVRVMERDVAGWETVACDTIRQERPDYLLTFQRFYPRETIVPQTAKEFGVRTLYADFGIGVGQGHYDRVVFDPMGENATSQVTGRLDELLAIPEQAQAADEPYHSWTRCASAWRRCPPANFPPPCLRTSYSWPSNARATRSSNTIPNGPRRRH